MTTRSAARLRGRPRVCRNWRCFSRSVVTSSAACRGGCFGLSAKAVLRGRLLTEAARLLRETTLSISEIAARIALGERRTFYLAFRQGFGCSPDAFRKG
jgi:AraC-like DNA-binding protein